MVDVTEEDSAVQWWAARRKRFNIGLLIAGSLAFIAYAAVLDLLSDRIPGAEITIFTILFQGIGYLVCMAIANVCYSAGPIVESFTSLRSRATYRRYAYAVGSAVCFVLPFSIPLLVWFTHRSPP